MAASIAHLPSPSSSGSMASNSFWYIGGLLFHHGSGLDLGKYSPLDQRIDAEAAIVRSQCPEKRYRHEHQQNAEGQAQRGDHVLQGVQATGQQKRRGNHPLGDRSEERRV